MASKRSRNSSSWPGYRWPERSRVDAAEVCPARTLTSLGLPAAIHRPPPCAAGHGDAAAPARSPAPPGARPDPVVGGLQGPALVGGEHVRVGVADRPQVLGQLLDHRPGQGHHAAGGPCRGWPHVQLALDLDHDLGHVHRAPQQVDPTPTQPSQLPRCAAHRRRRPGPAPGSARRACRPAGRPRPG
jgi:hypothetical protein